MIRLDADFEGLEELADAFLNWPERVAAATARANAKAKPILLRVLRRFTPKRSGFLRKSEDVVLIGPFYMEAVATAPYASIVNSRRAFMEPSVDAGMDEVEAAGIYEDAIDDVLKDL